MSLVSQLSDLTTAIATEFKNDRADIGDLASLATTVKSSLVAAINELASEVASGGGAVINDAAPSTSTVYSSTKTEAVAAAAAAAIINDAAADTITDETYSAQKITDLIATAISNLVDGADGAMDTLAELAAAIAGDETAISGINTALANRVRVDTAQGLTSGQKTQACSNIGAAQTSDVGDTTTDFVAIFDAALA